MRRLFFYTLPGFLLVASFVCPPAAPASTGALHKLSVFNFAAINLEAAPYGTLVTSILMQAIEQEPSLAVLDRKTLEAFLNLNDLQQRDDPANILHIGSRLGLNVIVTGNVEKRGTVILINCRVTQIAQAKVILSTQGRAMGDTHLDREVRRVARLITRAIADHALEPPPVAVEKKTPAAPVQVSTRPGSKRVYLSWENPPGHPVSGYELFRSTSLAGPFARIASTDRPEYTDQELERETAYYYRIRSFDDQGLQSPWSQVVAARTVLTPNPPVILRIEGQIKAVSLTWSPSAISSGDPSKLRGYKLYRAKNAEGPYQEVANVLGKDLGLGIDTATALDKIFRVSYIDRGLADGEENFYRLTAYNELNHESDFSAPLRGAAIPRVTGLSAQGGLTREIPLTWDQIDSPLIRGYYIYRSFSETGGFTKSRKVDPLSAGKRINFIDRDGLSDNMTYYYRVTAVDDAGMETSFADSVSALTRGKPPTPQGLQARSALVKRIELTWTGATEAEVEGYKVYFSRSREGKYDLLKRLDGRMTSSFSHGGAFEKLEDGSEYFYRITSVNRVEVESEPSPAIAAVTKYLPVKPAGLRGESFKVKEVPLRWQENPEKDVVWYHVFRRGEREDAFSKAVKLIGVTSYVDRGLTDGAIYAYRIQAEDKDGLLSDFSEPIRVQTKPRPKKLQGLKGESLTGKVELSWAPGGEPDIVHYVVYIKRFFGVDKIGTATSPNFSDAPLEKGKSKTYLVTSVDRDGLESDPSEELRVTGR